jgi:hypothetical protein
MVALDMWMFEISNNSKYFKIMWTNRVWINLINVLKKFIDEIKHIRKLVQVSEFH